MISIIPDIQQEKVLYACRGIATVSASSIFVEVGGHMQLLYRMYDMTIQTGCQAGMYVGSEGWGAVYRTSYSLGLTRMRPRVCPSSMAIATRGMSSRVTSDTRASTELRSALSRVISSHNSWRTSNGVDGISMPST